MIERQGRGGLVGPSRIVVAGADGVAGTAIVAGEDFGIDRPRRRQDQGQPLVVPAYAVRRKVSDDRLSDPVVVDLDLVLLGLADAADQPCGAERGQGHAAAGPQLRRLEGQRLADRPPRDGHDRQQPPGLLRLALDPRPEHLVQVELPDVCPVLGRLAALDVLDQLVDEQRIAPRFPRHHVRLRRDTASSRPSRASASSRASD